MPVLGAHEIDTGVWGGIGVAGGQGGAKDWGAVAEEAFMQAEVAERGPYLDEDDVVEEGAGG